MDPNKSNPLYQYSPGSVKTFLCGAYFAEEITIPEISQPSFQSSQNFTHHYLTTFAKSALAIGKTNLMETTYMHNYDDHKHYLPSSAPTHDQLLTKIQRFYEHLQELENNTTTKALVDYYFILFAEILCDDYT